MELVLLVGIVAPCAIVALLILVTVMRPSAAPALAMVLAAVVEPLRALTKRLPSKASDTEPADRTLES